VGRGREKISVNFQVKNTGFYAFLLPKTSRGHWSEIGIGGRGVD